MSSILAAGMGVALFAPAAAAEDRPVHYGGLKFSSQVVQADRLYASAPLPASVDLRAYAVPVGNQGAVDSCVAWSQGYAIAGWYANRYGKGGQPFAPMYMYSQIKVSNSGGGGGAYSVDGLQLLDDQGIAPKAKYSGDDYDFRTAPTSGDRLAAAPYKMAGFNMLYAGNTSPGSTNTAKNNAIKAALAGGDPVYLALPIYNEFDYLNAPGHDNVLEASEVAGQSERGGHAVVAMGYDSTGIQIQNSWGTGWGNAGYGTLAWDFVGQYVREAATLGGFESNTPVTDQDPDDSAGTFSVIGSSQQPATGNAKLELSSSTSLGATAAAFRSAKYTATVTTSTGTRKVSPTWVSSSSLRIALPAGQGGTDATIEIQKNGVSAGTVTVTYLGRVTAAAWKVDAATGARNGTITGTGLSKSQNWKLSEVAGSGEVSLPIVASQAALNSASAGVFLESDSRVQVKLPAQVAGGAGTWRVSFAPTSGAGFSALSPATRLDVKYTAPKISRLSSTAFAVTGGAAITVTGTDLAALDATQSDALVLRPTSSSVNSGQDIDAVITSKTQTQIGFTAPAAPAGQYRVVLKSGLGESADSGRTLDKLEAVAVSAVTSSSTRLLAGGGKLVLTTTGLGANAREMTAKKITAKLESTVNGRTIARPVALKWLSDTTAEATVPAGTPGQNADLIVYRSGIAAPAVTLTYTAGISGSSKAVLPTTGGTVKLTGHGLSGTFVLRNLNAGTEVQLDDVAPAADGKSAVITVPASAEGIYQVKFTPSGTFTGAPLAFTSKAILTVTDNG
ncbi:IPT/TIG domain-containing protein [Kineosporia babensis]|uniref:IPT/TIG domain-containing protein n=1 Tax=Kineosporia babensis TaxID=499548 RepID=UPI0022B0317C|nr:IPT/TIG domain-containing protein [Kineosporia babensis]